MRIQLMSGVEGQETDITDVENEEITRMNGNSKGIAGVNANINSVNNNEPGEQYNTMNDDDEISREDDSPNDTYVTINNINTVQEINAGQLNVHLDDPTINHQYNLRP